MAWLFNCAKCQYDCQHRYIYHSVLLCNIVQSRPMYPNTDKPDQEIQSCVDEMQDRLHYFMPLSQKQLNHILSPLNKFSCWLISVYLIHVIYGSSRKHSFIMRPLQYIHLIYIYIYHTLYILHIVARHPPPLCYISYEWALSIRNHMFNPFHATCHVI